MKSAFGKENKSAPEVEDSILLVTFRVGTEDYGLPINSITEAIRPHKITPLPRMPKFIEGVINLRGAIIPIVDLRKRFALAEIRDDARKQRMLIVKGATRAAADLLGLIVDGVSEVLTLPKKEIEPAPEAATGRQADFLTGMGKVGDRLIILLDITRILSQRERSELAEAEHVDH